MPKKRLLFHLGFFYLNLIGFFARLLPRRFMMAMAVLIGTLYWALMRRDREMVRRNLGRVISDPRKIAKTVRRTFIYYAKYLVDYTRMDLLRKEDLAGLVHEFCGRDHIDGTLSGGRGGLILTGHLGNWEMGGVFLTLLGYSLNIVTAPDIGPRLQGYRVRMRQEQRIKIIAMNGSFSSSLEVLGALKANELVALLGDRELFGRGIPVKFFGQNVLFPAGPALLAYLSGTPLIPTFVLLGPKNKYQCLAKTPLFPQNTGDRDRDVATQTQRIAGIMEELIRSHPEQWFTFYDFFGQHGVN